MKQFPHIIELKLMFGLYKMMKTVNKKAPQQYFHTLVDAHIKELLTKDFTYFLSDDFNDPQVAHILTKFKSEFRKADDETKDMIWRHLVVLYHNSTKCNLQRSNTI